MTPWFNVRIAQGGEINVLKLVKLIYLADREFMKGHGLTAPDLGCLAVRAVVELAVQPRGGLVGEQVQRKPWITFRATACVGR